MSDHLNLKTGFQDTGVYILDDHWHIHPNLNRIYRDGKDIRVPNKFMSVLICLIENPGMVSRKQLIDTVWPDSVVVEESLSRAIYELRKIFGDDSKNPPWMLDERRSRYFSIVSRLNS